MATMARLVGLACILGLVVTPAFASPRERPFSLEVGINTRQFAAASEGEQQVAFRTTGEIDPELESGTAVSTSLRFTGALAYDTFAGVEAEAGHLVGLSGSNLAGAYGVGGARGTLGPVRLSAELVAGRRWVRYSLVHHGPSDDAKWITEPRIRGDLWLSPTVTLGGAVGATLSERPVWIAGIYLGLQSRPSRPRFLD